MSKDNANQNPVDSEPKNEMDDALDYFQGFSNPDPACDGIERFFSVNGHHEIFKRFSKDKGLNLNKVQFNQLLVLSGLTSITFGFLKYYWLSLPNANHPYNIERLEGHDEDFEGDFFIESDDSGNLIYRAKIDNLVAEERREIYRDHHDDFLFRNHRGVLEPVQDLDLSGYDPVPNTVIKNWKHFRWGLRRVYVDALLFFGNITTGFIELGRMSDTSIQSFFEKRRFDTTLIKERGHALKFNDIPENDRYLISEMACQNLSVSGVGENRLRTLLVERYADARALSVNEIKVGVLLSGQKITKKNALQNVRKAIADQQLLLATDIEISTSDILEEVVSDIKDIDLILGPLAKRFDEARTNALHNTKLYLSLVNDMDVYVATSMRNKNDFLKMAKNCDEIFHNFPETEKLNLRYFDPTLSAAEGHEDKGIIECLMVKCAKVLIYSSGDKDSYGKDAEAAMALSSGKPVIFLCDVEIRQKIFREIHPLSKLVDFRTGVANGAVIASSNKEVAELLVMIFTNSMEFKLSRELEKAPDGSYDRAYFRLIDRTTDSTVRIQTSDLFLSKAFWNYYKHHVRD